MSAFKYKNPVYGYNVALFNEIFGENPILVHYPSKKKLSGSIKIISGLTK